MTTIKEDGVWRPMREPSGRWVAARSTMEGSRPYLWRDGETSRGGSFMPNLFDTLKQCEARCAELAEAEPNGADREPDEDEDLQPTAFERFQETTIVPVAREPVPAAHPHPLGTFADKVLAGVAKGLGISLEDTTVEWRKPDRPEIDPRKEVDLPDVVDLRGVSDPTTARFPGELTKAERERAEALDAYDSAYLAIHGRRSGIRWEASRYRVGPSAFTGPELAAATEVLRKRLPAPADSAQFPWPPEPDNALRAPPPGIGLYALSSESPEPPAKLWLKFVDRPGGGRHLRAWDVKPFEGAHRYVLVAQ